MSLKNCLPLLANVLKDFDTDEIRDAADEYEKRGMDRRDAELRAIDDHLEHLAGERARIEGEVLAAHAKAEGGKPKRAAKETITDVGEKIGGARKDLATKTGERPTSGVPPKPKSGPDAEGAVREGGIDYTDVKAKRATYGVDPRQLDLFPPEQREAHAAAVRAVVAIGRAESTILGSRIAADFREQGHTSLVGQTIEGPRDLAVLAQVYRDPRLETLRYYFTKDGKVVSQTGVTSRMPGAAFAAPVSTKAHRAGETETQAHAFFDRIMAAARDLGADTLWVQHNHPSGISEPSAPDIHLTNVLAKRAQEGFGLDFGGHVVIDHDEYSLILPGALTETFKDAELPQSYGKTPGTPHPVLGAKLENPLDLAEVAARLQADKDRIVLIGRDSRGSVGLVADANHEHLTAPRGWMAIRRLAVAHGVRDMFAANVPASLKADALRAMEEGFLQDAQLADGSSVLTSTAFTGSGLKLKRSADSFGRRLLGHRVEEPGEEYGLPRNKIVSWSMRFAKQVSGFLSGARDKTTTLELGDTPGVLQRLGAPPSRLTMRGSVINKALFEKHALTEGTLKQILPQLHEPVMVFDSKSEPGEFVLLTALSDKNGKPVIAAVHLRRQEGFEVVNKVASVYGKDDARDIQDWINLGLLRYVSKEKSPAALTSLGLQLPGEKSPSGSTQSILTEDDVFKAPSQKPGYSLPDEPTAPGKGLSPVAVYDHLAVPIKRAGELLGARVHVVSGLDDLPEAIRAQVDPKARPHALTYGKEVYLFADHLGTLDEARLAFAHDVMGHVAPNEAFGEKEWANIRNRVADMLKFGNTRAKAIAREIEDRYGRIDEDTFTREFIGVAAEKKYASTFAKFLSEIRAGIRRLLDRLGVKWPSLEDWRIDQWLSDSAAFFASPRGTARETEGRPQFAEGEGAHPEEPLFTPSTDHVSAYLKLLQNRDSAFRSPRTDAKRFADIADTVAHGALKGLEVTEHPDPRPAAESDIAKIITVSAKGWSGDAVLRQYKDGRLQLDSSGLKGGEGGSYLYQMAGDYAHNNGLTFEGDVHGLSPVAQIRRTDNMLSSAVRWGTTDHLAPHEIQANPEVQGVRPLNWIKGDHDHNLRELATSQWETLKRLAPEITGIRYNFDSGQFERRNGKLVPDKLFDRLALRARSAPLVRKDTLAELPDTTPVGRTSLKRAVFLKSLASESSDETWGRVLALAGERDGERRVGGLPPGITPEKLFYSMPSRASLGLPTPEQAKQRDIARGSLRENYARQDRAIATADRTLDVFRQHFDKRPKDVRADPLKAYADVIAFQQGREVKDPVARQFLDIMAKLLDDQVKAIHAANPEALQNLREHYFPQLWEDPKKAETVLADLVGKRPFEGNKGFTKARTFEDYEAGIKAGLKPRFDNPVDAIMMRFAAGERFLAALRVQKELAEKGLAWQGFSDRKAPEGYSVPDDRAFRKLIPTIHTDKETGNKEAAFLQRVTAYPDFITRDINNLLDPGLTKYGLWRTFRALQNFMLGARLGFSAFHAGMTTMDVLSTHLTQAGEHIVTGRVGEGLKELATAIPRAAASPFVGRKLLKQFFGEAGSDPQTAAVLEALVSGGMRVFMDPTDYNNAYGQFLRAWRRGETFEGENIMRVPGAIVEASTRWIMQHLVPYQKMVARVVLAKAELERLGNLLGTGKDYAATVEKMNPDVLRQTMRAVNAVVDDRLGQFCYDNEFWPKALKQVLQASVQSVGWNFGTLRVLAGGAADFGRIVKPEPLLGPVDKAGKVTATMPRVTNRAKYFIGFLATVGIAGAILQYLMTGQGPADKKDLFFPRTGKLNKDGTAERLTLPSYGKDAWALTHHPIQTLGHKLHPSLGMIAEMLNNKDFYGNQIHNPNDSLLTQAKQYAAYILKGFAPYAAQGAVKAHESGEPWPSAVRSFFGINPAPASITRSDFQSTIIEMSHANKGQGAPRTPEQAERSDQFFKALQAMRNGEHPDLQGFTPQERKQLVKYARTPAIEQTFKGLSLIQQLKAYDEATDEEKQQYGLRSLILTKAAHQTARTRANLSPDEQAYINDHLAAVRSARPR